MEICENKMFFRSAVMQDLPQLKAVYKSIIQNMDENQIRIWDDIYPCEFFEEDIKNNRLYVLFYNDELISAFALCEIHSGEKAVEWSDGAGKAMYIDRLGVNVNYSRMGMGSFMLEKAKETARRSGAEYLRLFVVDMNEPAVRLYNKNGFTKADGVYHEVIDADLVLHEYGFEAAL